MACRTPFPKLQNKLTKIKKKIKKILTIGLILMQPISQN